VREGLLIPGKLIGRRPAPAPLPVLSTPAAHPPPLTSELASATAMSFLPAKNLIFLQDTKNNFKFLVDSGASLSILPHSSLAPPTGPHLVGTNGKQIPAWGFRLCTVCFSGQNFKFDFFLAAVATPLLGMDFLTKFELSIIPSKQQDLHAASSRTFSKASTTPFISPWSPETSAAVVALPPKVQHLLEEFPSLLRSSAAPPQTTQRHCASHRHR
jgi:hypothetical protein